MLSGAGDDGLAAFRALAAKAGRGVRRCTLCARHGRAPDFSGGSDEEEEDEAGYREAQLLRLVATRSRLAFAGKTMALAAAGVRCYFRGCCQRRAPFWSAAPKRLPAASVPRRRRRCC